MNEQTMMESWFFFFFPIHTVTVYDNTIYNTYCRLYTIGAWIIAMEESGRFIGGAAKARLVDSTNIYILSLHFSVWCCCINNQIKAAFWTYRLSKLRCSWRVPITMVHSSFQLFHINLLKITQLKQPTHNLIYPTNS